LLAIQTEEELEERIATLVARAELETTAGEAATLIKPTNNAFISSTALALSTTETFDIIVNCSDDAPAAAANGNDQAPRIINLPISVKKQGNKTLRLGALGVLAKLESALKEGKRVVFLLQDR